MESNWRSNIAQTGNVGYYTDGSVFRQFHCVLIAQLVTPVLVSGLPMTHLFRYEYSVGRVTLWGIAISGGWVVPWNFFQLPSQTGPFPHGYAVLPDT